MIAIPNSHATIDTLAASLRRFPSVEDQCKLSHYFGPGVYLRSQWRPAGTFIIGHAHKTEHFNILLTGRLNVFMDGHVTQMVAPRIFLSKAGDRKMTFAVEDSTLITIHPTGETDLEKLEEELITKSPESINHELTEARKALAEFQEEK